MEKSCTIHVEMVTKSLQCKPNKISLYMKSRNFCTVLTGPMSIAHPSPNPDMKRPAIMTTLKASTFLMNHETPINVQPSKYGSSVMISVGLRPTISANEPATAPPNRAPIGAEAYTK